jgi:uncharacterized linocin/CFP29 family protein
MNSSSTTTDQMTALAPEQANKLRVARRALSPIIGQGFVESVPGHRVTKDRALSVRPNQHLQPLQMSRHFFLHKEQAADSLTLSALITFAAADIAQAEDAVILLGAGAEPLLRRLNIDLTDPEELRAQQGLLDHQQRKVEKPILESILDGIKTLRERGQSGEYYVIVSPDMFEQAHINRHTPLDAPIYQIQPLLASGGFLFSEAAPEKTGVIFSLARNTISLAVPMDIFVDTSLPNDSEGRPRFAVAEQIRLIIDDPEARVELR